MIPASWDRGAGLDAAAARREAGAKMIAPKLRGYGHYHEEYVRTADGWRVKSSTVKRLRVDTEGEV